MSETPPTTCPTSLVPLETSSQSPVGIELKGNYTPQNEFRSHPAELIELRWRHSGWAERRQKTWDALLRCCVSDSRLDRFSNCGSALWLQREKVGGEIRLTCNTCKDRWCVACQSQRGKTIAAVLEERMCQTTTRFLTFTRKHSRAPLADQIIKLYADFLALRRRDFWKAHVVGGAFFLEVKVGKGSGLWHPHLHVIAEGSYTDQRALSREWLAVTMDSSIVDVRAITSPADRARYVCKYVTKPATPDVYNVPHRFDEMITALKGKRLCGTFGTWRKMKLNPDTEDAPELEPIRSIACLRFDAMEGDTQARDWLEMAAAKWPGLRELFTPSHNSS